MDRTVNHREPTLPVVPEAEQGLVGSLLHDSARAWDVRSTLTADHFYEPKAAAIYTAILHALDAGQQPDLVTLVEYFRPRTQRPRIEVTDLVAYLEAEFSGDRASDYAALVRDAADRRNLILAAQAAITAAQAPSIPTGSSRERADAILLDTLTRRTCPRVVSAAEAMPEVEAALDDPGTAVVPVKTGYADLDRKLGGLQPGALYVVAARPSMGKSSLATSIAQNVAVRSRQPVLIFSLEVPRRQVLTNIACAEAKVPNTAVRDRRLDAAQRTRFLEAAGRVKEAPLFIDDTARLTGTQIRSTIRLECARRELRLAIVDYLQLAGGDRAAESREREVAEICAALKQAARENNIPIVALSQLNRAAEARKDKKPVISDLRESGAIEQDADAVLLLHREDYYAQQQIPDEVGRPTTVCIAKNRNGPTGLVTLVFFPQLTRFESCVPEHLLASGAGPR